jgi:hypothetical protein
VPKEEPLVLTAAGSTEIGTPATPSHFQRLWGLKMYIDNLGEIVEQLKEAHWTPNLSLFSLNQSAIE